MVNESQAVDCPLIKVKVKTEINIRVIFFILNV